VSVVRFARWTLIALVGGAAMIGCAEILFNLRVYGYPQIIPWGELFAMYGVTFSAYGAVSLFR
jgi:hypothetical protein